MDIDEIVQGKLDADSEFQTSIADLSGGDRNSAIESKRKELLSAEFKSLKDKADEAEKLQKAFEDQKKRAEKAETKIKEKEEGLSTKDVLVLSQAGVHADDIDEVVEFAKFKKISVAEALNNPTLKTILAEHVSQRETAQATQMKGKTSSQDKGGESLLQEASQGNLPTDDEGIAKLAEARHEARRNK